MKNIVTALTDSLNIDIAERDIRDIYRVKTNSETVKPIVVELNSALLKERVTQAVKHHNKNNPKEKKLNTSHLKVSGPIRPVYISETLTYKAQRLFYLARHFARENQLSYCWTSRGQVYLRKSDGATLHKINGESDLNKLKNNM